MPLLRAWRTGGVVLLAVLLMTGCSDEPAWGPQDAAVVYSEYQNVNLDFFFEAPPEGPAAEHPLYRGLQAKLDGRLAEAERHLEAAVSAVPDSLRRFVHDRLRAINERRYDWEGAVRHRARADTSFSKESTVAMAIQDRPAPRLVSAPDTARAPFDGLRTRVQIDGGDEAVPAVLDTGAPATSVSRSVVRRYDLPVDTSTAVGRSVVPAFGIDAPKYPTRIDRIEIGGVVLRNVPATVTWTESGSGEGGPGDTGVFLGARLLRYAFDEIRYDYADSTFAMIRDVPREEDPPNFGVMSDGWPIVQASADGEPVVGVIDTGSPYSWLNRSSFPPSDYTLERTRTGTTSSGYEWSVDVYRVPVVFPGGASREKFVIQKSLVGKRPYRMQAFFGRDLWTDGTLVIDYQNRRARYAPSEANS